VFKGMHQHTMDHSIFRDSNSHHKTVKTIPALTVREGIIRTLIYFDLFSYPLDQKEIRQYGSTPEMQDEKVQRELLSLCEEGSLHTDGRFYGLRPVAALVERRLKGNKAANNIMPKAYKISKRISRFPFVRSVMLSGSMSKGYLADDGDVDLFVITEPGRLWLTRTLLMLYKKIFLLNSHKYFCVNYLITTDQLEIPDKNLFTATEVMTLIPTYHPALYAHFQEANKWANELYPNFPKRKPNGAFVPGKERSKKAIEKIFVGKIGDRLDNACLNLTLKLWKRKFEHFDPETFELAMRSNKSTSKHHPRNFQEKVMNAYNARYAEFGHLLDQKEEIAK